MSLRDHKTTAFLVAGIITIIPITSQACKGMESLKELVDHYGLSKIVTVEADGMVCGLATSVTDYVYDSISSALGVTNDVHGEL